METKEYELLDGRTIRAKYNRLGRCNISKENLESFVNEFNTSYRQAKILEKIKENYALMKADERKKGRWICVHHIENKITYDSWKCSECQYDFNSEEESMVDFDEYAFCPNCGAEMESENEIKII